MIGRCRLANPTIRKGILCYLSGCYLLRSQLSLDAGEVYSLVSSSAFGWCSRVRPVSIRAGTK